MLFRVCGNLTAGGADGRAAFLATCSSQTGAHLKRGAVPRVVQAGLTKSEHVANSTSLDEIPLDIAAPLSLATKFAIDMVVKAGSSIVSKRSEIVRHHRRRAKQLSRLDSELKALMPESVRRVGMHANVAF